MGNTGQWRLAGLVGLMVAMLTVAGCSLGRHGGKSTDDASERVTRIVDRVFSRVDATDAQKERINVIATTALRELKPLRDTLRATRIEGIELFSAMTIDRTAIETFRADRIDDLTRASAIMATAMADIAEVLTPAQREQLRDKLLERLEGRQHAHGWWR
ncbi:MAG: Spy/CpxP family protein refolding chaperone [Propionivibrio sp.]